MRENDTEYQAQYAEANKLWNLGGAHLVRRIKSEGDHLERALNFFKQSLAIYTTLKNTEVTPGKLKEERDLVIKHIKKVEENLARKKNAIADLKEGVRLWNLGFEYLKDDRLGQALITFNEALAPYERLRTTYHQVEGLVVLPLLKGRSQEGYFTDKIKFIKNKMKEIKSNLEKREDPEKKAKLAVPLSDAPSSLPTTTSKIENPVQLTSDQSTPAPKIKIKPRAQNPKIAGTPKKRKKSMSKIEKPQHRVQLKGNSDDSLLKDLGYSEKTVFVTFENRRGGFYKSIPHDAKIIKYQLITSLGKRGRKTNIPFVVKPLTEEEEQVLGRLISLGNIHRSDPEGKYSYRSEKDGLEREFCLGKDNSRGVFSKVSVTPPVIAPSNEIEHKKYRRELKGNLGDPLLVGLECPKHMVFVTFKNRFEGFYKSIPIDTQIVEAWFFGGKNRKYTIQLVVKEIIPNEKDQVFGKLVSINKIGELKYEDRVYYYLKEDGFLREFDFKSDNQDDFFATVPLERVETNRTKRTAEKRKMSNQNVQSRSKIHVLDRVPPKVPMTPVVYDPVSTPLTLPESSDDSLFPSTPENSKEQMISPMNPPTLPSYRLGEKEDITATNSGTDYPPSSLEQSSFPLAKLPQNIAPDTPPTGTPISKNLNRFNFNAPLAQSTLQDQIKLKP